MLREKLLSGKLSKHSEQLNKFVAGFFDSDGSVYLCRDRGAIALRCSINQSAAKDPDFEIMRSLHRHYSLGTLNYVDVKKGSAQCSWRFGATDSKKLFNLIGKHLLIKATHFKNCINSYNSKTFMVDEEYKNSRNNSTYLKRPKHISWAYLSGLIS